MGRAEASGVNARRKCRLSETSLNTGIRRGRRDRTPFLPYEGRDERNV